MDVEYDDDHLRRLAFDVRETAGHGDAVDRGYRKVIQIIRAAVDERDLYKHKSLNFKQRKGEDVRSLRINKQWRLYVELRGEAPTKRIGVLRIADDH